MFPGAGDLVQLVKFLLYKHEDLSQCLKISAPGGAHL